MYIFCNHFKKFGGAPPAVAAQMLNLKYSNTFVASVTLWYNSYAADSLPAKKLKDYCKFEKYSPNNKMDGKVMRVFTDCILFDACLKYLKFII